jgi:hypothetical protein
MQSENDEFVIEVEKRRWKFYIANLKYEQIKGPTYNCNLILPVSKVGARATPEKSL